MSEFHYTHVTRRELRQMLASGVGLDPSGDSADQMVHSLNEYIRSGALKAAEQFHHYYPRHGEVVETGEEQGEIPFPTGCGPGSILQVSVWITEDTVQSIGSRYPRLAMCPANTFVPLTRMDPGNSYDHDPSWDAGGEDMAEVVGTPMLYTVRDKILIRPLTDQAYKLKILFTRIPELNCDNDVTALDGELILRYAKAEFYQQAEEFSNADRWEQKAQERVEFLRGMQNSDQIHNYMAGVSFRLSAEEEAGLWDYATGIYDMSYVGQNYAPLAIRTVNVE